MLLIYYRQKNWIFNLSAIFRLSTLSLIIFGYWIGLFMSVCHRTIFWSKTKKAGGKIPMTHWATRNRSYLNLALICLKLGGNYTIWYFVYDDKPNKCYHIFGNTIRVFAHIPNTILNYNEIHLENKNIGFVQCACNIVIIVEISLFQCTMFGLQSSFNRIRKVYNHTPSQWDANGITWIKTV